MSNLTIDQKNFVHELAQLAYGTGGSSEKTHGGKGNMGLLYGANGSVRVFKCNTHHSQAANMQQQVNKLPEGNALLESSNALRAELEKLAASAGMDNETVKRILGANETGKALITRKIVAGFVTELSTRCDDLGHVWDGVTGVKSESDMSFEKVVKPDASHQKFNCEVAGLNEKIVRQIVNFRRGIEDLRGDSMSPFEGELEQFADIAGIESNSKLTAPTMMAVGNYLTMLDSKGFGWLAQGTPFAFAVGDAIAKLHPELSVDDARLVAARLVKQLKLEKDVYQALTAGNLENFQDFVAAKLEGIDPKAVLEAEFTLNEALELISKEFANSDLVHLPPAVKGQATPGMIIQENLLILKKLARNYDAAMKAVKDYQKADPKRTLDWLDGEGHKTGFLLMTKIERTLELKTLDGHKLSIHTQLGVKNMIASMEIGHGFAAIYQTAKAHGKVHDLLLALAEDGCFQARMAALQNFVARLEGVNANDVKHADNETVADGLTKELAEAVREYMDQHNGETPTWSQIKEAFGQRMSGKVFANVNWTPQKIYQHLTKDILEMSMVDPDPDFDEHVANALEGRVHYAEL